VGVGWHADDTLDTTHVQARTDIATSGAPHDAQPTTASASGGACVLTLTGGHGGGGVARSGAGERIPTAAACDRASSSSHASAHQVRRAAVAPHPAPHTVVHDVLTPQRQADLGARAAVGLFSPGHRAGDVYMPQVRAGSSCARSRRLNAARYQVRASDASSRFSATLGPARIRQTTATGPAAAAAAAAHASFDEVRN
jgi:hypothetical protein